MARFFPLSIQSIRFYCSILLFLFYYNVSIVELLQWSLESLSALHCQHLLFGLLFCPTDFFSGNFSRFWISSDVLLFRIIHSSTILRIILESMTCFTSFVYKCILPICCSFLSNLLYGFTSQVAQFTHLFHFWSPMVVPLLFSALRLLLLSLRFVILKCILSWKIIKIFKLERNGNCCPAFEFTVFVNNAGREVWWS